MIVLLQLIALGVVVLIGIQAFKALRREKRGPMDGGRVAREDHAGVTIDQRPAKPVSPAKSAAETLREFEKARSTLKASYPSIFAMLGGYLNDHTMSELGSIEAAVKEMIADWTPRRDVISRELTKLLADNESEEELRAVIVAACDGRFDEEGYRKWLTWLLGRFNAIG